MKVRSIASLVILLWSLLAMNYAALGQSPYATWSDTTLVLQNEKVHRTIKLPGSTGPYLTIQYRPVKGSFHFFTPETTDFSFEVDGLTYNGRSNWRLSAVKPISDATRGSGAAVTLVSDDQKVEVTVRYLLYPNNSAIRKNLVIRNLTDKAQKIESVDIEKFEVEHYYPSTYSWICHDYGRRRSLGPYEGNAQDALVIVHESNWREGIVMGNEASGVLKRTAAFWETLDISTGLTHKDGRYPFRKWIDPSQSFSTPQVFTMVYDNQKDPDQILNTDVADFVRKYMGIRLSALSQKPTFVYNTWIPFTTHIDETTIRQLAKSAADAGMKEFIIDDGWESNFGDWEIDPVKFPNGLKPVFDYIRSLGMKPGLWVSVGSASPSSRVYREHPEWFAKDNQNRFTNLHIEDSTIRTACFGTGWYDYIKKILLRLSQDYGLEYMKLDFTVVTSPYRYAREQSGCYATDHSGHRDHHESLYTNFERVWQLFDELHQAKPELFIDCTFETMGGVQLIDYALVKHAEGDWLANFIGPDEIADLRIRNMSWWRSPAMPASALVIGNPELQDKGWELHIQSMAGSLPIILGDPRKLSPTDLAKCRAYGDWLLAMERKHGIMSYRQDLPGFGEPKEGSWDGFQRINTDSRSGGIIGVFRQGNPSPKVSVMISFLDPGKMFKIKEPFSGKVISRQSGVALATKGFEVTIAEIYGGRLFEVTTE